MDDGTKRVLMVKELVGGALLVAMVLAFGVGFALTPASGGMFRGASKDPDRIRKHADIAVEIALREVDATPDQVARVQAVAHDLITTLSQAHDRHEANRAVLLQELKKPEVSRESLQSLRADELALFEGASVKVVDAVADAAAVLTPEQRAKLLSWVEEMHDHGH